MRIKRLLLCLIILMMPIFVKAEDVEYTLYDSNIKVNINRTIDVTENYKIYFIEDANTMTRKLDLSPYIIRPSKSKLYTTALVDNIESSIKHDIKRKKNNEIITFNVNGLQDSVKSYDLKYHYNLGKDGLRGKDELFYDIVKNLDAPISNLVFSIEFPSSIEDCKVYFAIDGKYNLNEDDISYEVKDNKITGTLNILLSSNQAFSVYVELPDGYFKGATENFNYINYIKLLFPAICLLIVFIFYNKYGRGITLKIKRKDTIYKDFDSAEIGYLYKGKMEEMDLTSLVIYLATKGYLRIVEHDDGYKLGKENSFHFEKIRDYDKNNAAQELICNELFRDRDKTELKDIEYHFADTFKEALHMLGNDDNYSKLFFKGITSIKFLLGFLITLVIIFNNARSVYLFTNTYLLLIPFVLFMLFGLYVVFISNMTSVIKGIIGTIVLGGTLYVGITPIISQQHYLTIYLVTSILVFAMTYFYTKLSDRTEFGSMVLGETYGLKYYLQTISQTELKDHLSLNPNYYFNMIPYACTLNCLEEYIDRGKNIVDTPPSWYVPANDFNLKDFEKFINNVLYTTSLVMMKHNYLEELVSYEEKQQSSSDINNDDTKKTA